MTKLLQLGRDFAKELTRNNITTLASGAAFTIGGVLPFLVTLFLPLKSMEYSLYGLAILFLAILGSLAAKTGGSSISKAVIRFR